MSSSQFVLNVILFMVIFTIALDLKTDNFIRVAKNPLPISAGLWAIWHNTSGLVLAQLLRVRATRLLKPG